MPAPLAVPFWQPGAACPAATGELWLAAVATPYTTQRDAARRAVRELLHMALGRRLACPPDAVALRSAPGEALRVEGRPDIGLSVSHEAGLSLAAIHWAGPVGIDLLALPEAPVWQDDLARLAGDYLGPAAAARLGALPADERRPGFAAAWTAHEARLKYLGIGLAEWQPALDRRLAACPVRPLALPAGYVGSVAA